MAVYTKRKSDSFWENYKAINAELRKSLFCIPPYQCVTGKLVSELAYELKQGNLSATNVTCKILSPGQRAYQVEYRYKQCRIFTPFMSVIEYACFDAMNGNEICAYMTLLPLVEAVLRKWADEDSALSFNKMKGFALLLDKYLKEKEYYLDDRCVITDEHIEYLRYILGEVLYEDFDAYESKNFSMIFNRNLTSHKLEGTTNRSEVLFTMCRILLVLDIIAELYLMQYPKLYWDNVFYVNPENDKDYQVRFNLYVKLCMLSIGPNDLLLIDNLFLSSVDDNIKQVEIDRLSRDINRIMNSAK